jgi:2-oxoglutarate ferredoxin oxidoreductase subunit alpha
VLTKEDLQKMAKYFRYHPEDADGVAARTLPGVDEKGAYFTRGSGHNKLGGYTEKPAEYQEVVDRLARKHRASAEAVPGPVIEARPGGKAKLGVVSLGGCDGAVREAVGLLAERGIEADYMRVRGFPFGARVIEFFDQHERVFIVEQNRDAQLKTLIVAETPILANKLSSVLVYGGFPLSARQVVDGITSQLGGSK